MSSQCSSLSHVFSPQLLFCCGGNSGLACSAGAAAASCLQVFRLREPAVPAPALVFLECPFLPESNN